MIIVKVGGGATINVRGIAADLAVQKDVIVVHGANARRDALATALGQPKQVVTSVSGYESVLSDAFSLDVMMMTYAGVQNKRLVEALQQQGVNAVGLSGLDGRVVQGRRNKGIRVKEGEKTVIKRDLSGKPQTVNKKLLQLLLDNGYMPVLTMPILDENNIAINSENDDVVVKLQEAFHAETIVQLIEAPGFLNNKDDENSLVRSMTQQELAEQEERVTGRMKRKLLALQRLFEAGATEVIMSDGRTAHPVADALTGRGTVIR